MARSMRDKHRKQRVEDTPGGSPEACSDDPYEQVDPASRYKLFGRYDPDSYNDDVRDFPDFFDENGWPLFGEADPYAERHPITGRPWYEAPRIPTSSETDVDYERWFQFAEQLNSADAKVVSAMRGLRGMHLAEPPLR